MHVFLGAIAVAVVAAMGGCGDRDKTNSPPAEPNYDYLAITDARTGQVVAEAPDLEATDAVPDGRGGWIVGSTTGLVRLRHDGTRDPSWGTNASREISVCRLARSGRRAIARFQDVREREWVGAFEPRTGNVLWKASIGTQDDQYRSCALQAGPTHVFIGGSFRTNGEGARQVVAALDARTGQLLAWRHPRLGNNVGQLWVGALALTPRRLYLAGTFGTVGGRKRIGFAAVSPTTGRLLPWKSLSVAPNADHGIFPVNGKVVVAGEHGAVVFDERSGHEIRHTILSHGHLFPTGRLLYVGGDVHNGFSELSGKPRNNLAAYDLTTGELTDWAPNLDVFVNVGSVVPAGDRVLVVGVFVDTIG
jgi:outer membrane protein assembly factor BamB